MSLKNKSLEILYEDNHLIVINKKSGDLVQGDKTGDIPLSERVKMYIKESQQKPGNVYLGVVHRLDRPTSGLVIFAKTSKALTRLNETFRKKDLTKTYWAVVKRPLTETEATLVHYMIRNPQNNTSKAHIHEVPNSKKAILHYKLLKSFDQYALVEIVLETGRHHQIRAQMKAIGNPIKGDLKYGSKRSNPDGSIHLHARNIRIKHPTKDEILDITAPVPDDVLWKQC